MEDLIKREVIINWIRQEFPCGQDEVAGETDCKRIWLPYKKRCPECMAHPTEREEMADRLISALIRP